MTLSSDKRSAYLNRIGARILSEANDLKRTPDVLAKELGWSDEIVRRVIAGSSDLETARSLMMAMADFYPISLGSLWIEPDDTDGGVMLMSAGDSIRSGRIFSRADRNGVLTDYYEYRDTAMSRLAPYKPEWIQPLRTVTDNDPDNPDVAFNNGHLMHQLTFFIGDVNFYWRADGVKNCREMKSGDSCYITPFVPHSFTSRDPDKLGTIVAITYGAEVARSLDSLSRLSSGAADRLSGDRRDRRSFFAARLDRYRHAQSLPISGLIERIASAGIGIERARGLAEGTELPDTRELHAIADGLGLSVAHLMVDIMHTDQIVVVCRETEASPRSYPDTNRPCYELRELARSHTQPGLRGFVLETTGAVSDCSADLEHGEHEYVYNFGDVPIGVAWPEGRTGQLNPGDSAYIGPMVKHRFLGPHGARAVVVRIPGDLTDSVFDEFAAYDTAGRHRVIRETKRWF